MNAGQVHAVIAAGLKDPGLLTRWKQEPDILRRCGVDPDSVDLETLWKFAALTTKVRHNGLRAEIPATFRLLNIAGLEVEVFGAYTTFHAGKSFGPTVEARSDQLLAFLEQWLDFDKREHALLWDLIRHELALVKLRKLEIAHSSRRLMHSAGSSVPRRCGEIILHEMQSDPRTIEAQLKLKTPRLERVALGTFYFCYWRLDAEDIYVLDLDALSFYALSTINGERSVAELSQLLNSRRKPPKLLLNSLAELAAIGVIRFD